MKTSTPSLGFPLRFMKYYNQRGSTIDNAVENRQEQASSIKNNENNDNKIWPDYGILGAHFLIHFSIFRKKEKRIPFRL